MQLLSGQVVSSWHGLVWTLFLPKNGNLEVLCSVGPLLAPALRLDYGGGFWGPSVLKGKEDYRVVVLGVPPPKGLQAPKLLQVPNLEPQCQGRGGRHSA